MDREGEGAEIAAFLRSLGATEEQIVSAWHEGHVAALAGDLTLTQGARLTPRDLATRSGIGVDELCSVWRALGIDVPDEDGPQFTEQDAELIAFLVHDNPVGSHGGELLRVLSGSLERVAEAAVSVYVQTQEPDHDAPDLDLLAWAREQALVCGAALRLGDSMGAIFAHHLRAAIERQRTAQHDVHDRAFHRLAVGFVDLAGYTPWSLHRSPASLLEVIGAFEDRAFALATSHHGRIVKHLGDEVMFVAPDAAAGCAIARSLTVAFGSAIDPRGGVCFGDVIARYGDYYGPVVNMASRLTDLAIPGEVLTDAATAAQAGHAFEFRAAGDRILKGFERPIEVRSVGPELVL